MTTTTTKAASANGDAHTGDKKQGQSRAERGGSIASMAIGIGILVIGPAWLISTWIFMETGVSTYGTIVAIEATGGADYPAFAYQTESGVRHVARGIGSNHPLYVIRYVYPVGDRVPVIYDPDDPHDAKIDAFMQMWAPPIFVSLFGLYIAISIIRKDTSQVADGSHAESKLHIERKLTN